MSLRKDFIEFVTAKINSCQFGHGSEGPIEQGVSQGCAMMPLDLFESG